MRIPQGRDRPLPLAPIDAKIETDILLPRNHAGVEIDGNIGPVTDEQTDIIYVK